MAQSITSQSEQYGVFGPPLDRSGREAGYVPESAVREYLRGPAISPGLLHRQIAKKGNTLVQGAFRQAVDTSDMDPNEHAYYGDDRIPFGEFGADGYDYEGVSRGEFNRRMRDWDEGAEGRSEMAGEDDESGYNWGPTPDYDPGSEPGPHPDFHGDRPHPFGTPIYNPHQAWRLAKPNPPLPSPGDVAVSSAGGAQKGEDAADAARGAAGQTIGEAIGAPLGPVGKAIGGEIGGQVATGGDKPIDWYNAIGTGIGSAGGAAVGGAIAGPPGALIGGELGGRGGGWFGDHINPANAPETITSEGPQQSIREQIEGPSTSGPSAVQANFHWAAAEESGLSGDTPYDDLMKRIDEQLAQGEDYDPHDFSHWEEESRQHRQLLGLPPRGGYGELELADMGRYQEPFEQGYQVPDHPGHSRHKSPAWEQMGMSAEEWNQAGRPEPEPADFGYGDEAYTLPDKRPKRNPLESSIRQNAGVPVGFAYGNTMSEGDIDFL